MSNIEPDEKETAGIIADFARHSALYTCPKSADGHHSFEPLKGQKWKCQHCGGTTIST